MRTDFSLVPRMDYGRSILRLPYSFVLIFLSFSVCAMEADDSPACISHVNVTLNDVGEGLLYPSMFVRGSSANYTIDPSVIDCSNAGNVLMITVTDTVTHEVCWSSLHVEDKSMFDVVLKDTIVNCVEPLDSIRGLIIGIVDNCIKLSDIIDSSYVDVIDSIYESPSDTLKVIKRIWNFESSDGKSITKTSTIAIRRFSAAMIPLINFPPDDTVYCVQNPLDVNATGVPTLYGAQLMDLCGIMQSTMILDSIPQGCDSKIKYRRLWVLMDWETEQMWRDTQTIYKIDTIIKSLSIPALNFVHNTTNCNFSFILPPPVVSSTGCTGGANTFTSKVNGQIAQIGSTVSAEYGQLIIEYSGTNDCLDSLIGVKDTMQVLDPGLVNLECSAATSFVGIAFADSSDRNVWVNNLWTDNGTSCMPFSIVGRKVDSTCTNDSQIFSKQITLCEANIGSTVMVEIAAMDTLGRISADRCMVMVDVQDKRIATSNVRGTIKLNGKEPLTNATLVLKNNNGTWSANTDASGEFLVNDVIGTTAQVEFKGFGEWRDGITANDIYLLQNILNGVDDGTDMYKMISADVDQSGSINGSDLLNLKRIVLGMPIGELQNISEWLFFENDNNLEEVLFNKRPLLIDAMDLSKEIEISCVKRGDLDGDIIAGAGTRQSFKNIVLSSEKSLFRSGTNSSISINIGDQFHAAQLDISLPNVEGIVVDNENVISSYKNNILRLIYAESTKGAKGDIEVRFVPKRNVFIDELQIVDGDFPSWGFDDQGKFELQLVKELINQENSFEFTINPNPSSGDAHIQFSNLNYINSSQKLERFKMLIYDAVGRVVKEETFSHINLSEIFPIPIKEELARGHYLISINIDDRIYNLKYVKL